MKLRSSPLLSTSGRLGCYTIIATFAGTRIKLNTQFAFSTNPVLRTKTMSTPPFYVATRDGRKCTTLNSPPGYGPWCFQDLHEPELTQRLHRMSRAKTSTTSGLRVDSVEFQPCPSEDELSQDRIFSGRCEVEGDESPWSLVGVFDGRFYNIAPNRTTYRAQQTVGHAGHDCADHTVTCFPEHLRQALSKRPDRKNIASAVSRAFVSFDDAITKGVLSIFPNVETLKKTSEVELRKKINDHQSGGENYKKIILAMRGTTALTALIDGPRKNLWVAGVGDCRASTYASPALGLYIIKLTQRSSRCETIQWPVGS